VWPTLRSSEKLGRFPRVSGGRDRFVDKYSSEI